MWTCAPSSSATWPSLSAFDHTVPDKLLFSHTNATHCRIKSTFPTRLLLSRYQNRHKFVRYNCSSSASNNIEPEGQQESHPQTKSETDENSSNSAGDSLSFWQKWKLNSAEMSQKLAKLGLAAILAYGIFDGITYTTFFILAFFGYEKSTGQNPAANIKALIGIVLLMWTGNNVTRPFRVAGAAALAPVIDNGLRKLQKTLNLPKLVYAFALVVGVVATLCFSIIGLVILSRWGK